MIFETESFGPHLVRKLKGAIAPLAHPAPTPLLKAIDKDKHSHSSSGHGNEDLSETLQPPIATCEVGHCPVDEL